MAEGQFAAVALFDVGLVFDGGVGVEHRPGRPARIGVDQPAVAALDDLRVVAVAGVGAAKGVDAQSIGLCGGREAHAILVPAAQITGDVDHYR